MGFFGGLFRRNAKAAAQSIETPAEPVPAESAIDLFGPAPPPRPRSRLYDFDEEESAERVDDAPPIAWAEPEPAPVAQPPLPQSEREPPATIEGYAEMVSTAEPEPAASLEILADEPAPGAEAPSGEPIPEIASLLADFETLGGSAEFSLFCQAVGGSPSGLFDFASVYPGALIAMLRDWFSGTGETENLEIFTYFDFYHAKDTRYGFDWKTDIAAHAMAEGPARIAQSERLVTLRRALITHLAENQRLFVYAGPASESQVTEIRAGMGEFGENTLLHVVEAGPGDTPGQVVWHQAGVLRGYLRHSGLQHGKWDIAVDDWVAICRAAHALWKPNAA